MNGAKTSMSRVRLTPSRLTSQSCLPLYISLWTHLHFALHCASWFLTHVLFRLCLIRSGRKGINRSPHAHRWTSLSFLLHPDNLVSPVPSCMIPPTYSLLPS